MSDDAHASDEALHAALVRGELRAFDLLYQRYERPLFGFIRRQLPAQQDAEDVLHETFLSLLRERKTAPAVQQFRAFIFQTARNLCLNRTRNARRAAQAIGRAETEAAPLASHPEELLAASQDREVLARAVAALPPEQANLYRLRVGGLSYEELAERLAIPVGTVKSRMHHLVQHLREEIDR